MANDTDAHAAKVAGVQAAIRQAREQGTTVKVYHGSTNSTRPFVSDRRQVVDVSAFRVILEINADKSYVWVEPNVALDQLVDAVLPHGLVPPLVAEFPGITVGGAIQGGSGESSSFKYGGFHDTCLEYEMVLGDGSVIMASPAKNADIFHGTAYAYGSLGILTKVKIKLVPATQYVKLTYQRASSAEQTIAMVQAAVATPIDFVDAIIFSKTSATVMTGEYVDQADHADLAIAKFHSPFDDWFYLHAERLTSQHDTYQELIPLRDYLFRYDRGGFWAAKYGFQHVPFNRFTRTLLAYFLKTRTLYKLVLGSNYAYEYMTQDLCMPQETIGDLIKYCNRQYAIMPLWICPLKAGGKDRVASKIKTDLVINLGLWGPMKASSKTARQRNRELEAEVTRLGGRKVLYAHAYYPETEFWQLFDKKQYDTLRQATHSEGVFPDLYHKVFTPPASHQPSKRRGALALLRSPYKLK